MQGASELTARLAAHPLVRGVDVLPRGHLRVETPFLYPDGSSVDVFIVDDAPLLPPHRLSDLGQTTDFLLHHAVKPWTTKKRRLQLEDAIALHGARLAGGALELEFRADDPASLDDGIVRLAQACLRMSDLVFTKRLQMQSSFVEDVEELLTDVDVDYQPSAEVPGQFAPVQVDFLVKGQTTTSAVLTLAARLAPASHQPAVEVFTKFHDLARAGSPVQRITLVDDRVDTARIYREQDLRRIAEYSIVVPFSDRPQVRALLAA